MYERRPHVPQKVEYISNFRERQNRLICRFVSQDWETASKPNIIMIGMYDQETKVGPLTCGRYHLKGPTPGVAPS